MTLLALAAPSAATTAPGNGGADQLTFSILYELTSGSNAPVENCGERTSSNGARAYICSSYEGTGDGSTNGYYRGTLSGSTTVQIRIDGDIRTLATFPDVRGFWRNAQSVHFRACGGSTCGAWS